MVSVLSPGFAVSKTFSVNVVVHEPVDTAVEEPSHLNRIKNAIPFGRKKELPRMPSSQNIRRMAKRLSTSVGKKTEAPAPIFQEERKNILQGTSLEELCRLGGLGPLRLPDGFTPIEVLKIPSSLAATATYVVESGASKALGSPLPSSLILTPPTGPLIEGTFRHCGAQTESNALYNRFATQYIHYAHIEDSDRIQSTICTNDMPADIKYGIHEVATVFKNIVRGLPGGLLGSLPLYDALKDVRDNQNQHSEQPETEDRTTIARLIALALSCVSSDCRLSVICTVLGIFAWMCDARESSANPEELMGYDGFSTILAPMLIGDDLTKIKEDEQLGGEFGNPDDRELTVLEKQSLPHARHAIALKIIGEGRSIAYMLLLHWKEIVPQLQALAATCPARPHEDWEQQRLSSTDSQYRLQPFGAFVQGEQQADVFTEATAAKKKVGFANISLQPSKDLKSSKSSHSLLPRRPLTNSSQSAPTLYPYARWFENGKECICLPDGTGDVKGVKVAEVPTANDGNKSRARASRYSKPEKQKPREPSRETTGESMYSLPGTRSKYSLPGPRKQPKVRTPGGLRISAPFNPTFTADPTNWLPREIMSEGPSSGIGNLENGPNPPANEIDQKSGDAPTYETGDQPDGDFFDDEYNTEDRMSDYACLLSTIPSGSEDGELDQDHKLEEDLHIQQVIEDSLGAPVQERSYQQEASTRKAPRPLTPTTGEQGDPNTDLTPIGQPNHSAQSSFDVGKFNEGLQDAILGSYTPRNRQLNRISPGNDGVNEDTPRASKDPFNSSSDELGDSSSFENTLNCTDNQEVTAVRTRLPERSFQDNERYHPAHKRTPPVESVASSQSGNTFVLAQLGEQHEENTVALDRPRPRTAPKHYKFPSSTIGESAGIKDASPAFATSDDQNTLWLQEEVPPQQDSQSRRTLIPKPLEEIGEPRLHSPGAKAPPEIPVRKRPPMHKGFSSFVFQTLATPNMNPFDSQLQRSSATAENSSPYLEERPSARTLKPSAGPLVPEPPSGRTLSAPLDLETKVMLMKMGAYVASDAEVELFLSKKLPSRPGSLHTNNTVMHQRTGSQGSHRRYSASQYSDDHSGITSASEKMRRLSLQDKGPAALYEHIRRLDQENARKDALIEAYERKEREREEAEEQRRLKAERTQRKREQFKQRQAQAKEVLDQAIEAKKEALALRKLKEEYDEEELWHAAYLLKETGRPFSCHHSNNSAWSFTTQEGIDMQIANGYPVELCGPPPKIPTLKETRAQLKAQKDDRFINRGMRRSAFTSMDKWDRELLPYVEHLRAQQKQDGTLARLRSPEAMEEFRKKVEWVRSHPIKLKWELEAETEEREREQAEEQSAEETDDALTPAEKSEEAALNPLTPAERLEKLIWEAEEERKREGGRNWLGFRKASKSDESQLLKKSSPKDKGMVKGLTKLFGGGKEKF